MTRRWQPGEGDRPIASAPFGTRGRRTPRRSTGLALACAGFVVASLAAIPAARANDSAAAIGIGGLVLTPDPDIALLSEDLRIAVDRIDVSYVFHNNGPAARTVEVAFPLPPIDGALSLTPQSLPDVHRPNFVDFTIKVDGAPLEPALEERAFLGKEEVSARLRALGLPLNPLRRADLAAAVKRLTSEQKAGLVAAGLLSADADDVTATWRSEAKFHWAQSFPAGKDIAVEHHYRPVRGMLLVVKDEAEDHAFRDLYCLDDVGLSAIKALLARTGDKIATGGALYGAVVPYILTTARNWAGPIGTFKLTVDKGSPDTLVSLCKQVVKTGPTTFVWSAQNYRPDHDLAVLFVSNDGDLLGIK